MNWSDQVTNAIIITSAQLPSLNVLLCSLVHVHCLPDQRIQNVLLYKKLVTGKKVTSSLLQGHVQKAHEGNGHENRGMKMSPTIAHAEDAIYTES